MLDLRVGDRVRVRTVTGSIAERVVADHSDEGVPLFCTLKEYESAHRESRKPEGIGWPEGDIVETVTEASAEGRIAP